MKLLIATSKSGKELRFADDLHPMAIEERASMHRMWGDSVRIVTGRFIEDRDTTIDGCALSAGTVGGPEE